jgi:metal-responsive CopG/Arc/MetJ family transcriptional regulator
MSRITITLPNDLVEELLGAVEAKSKTDAVVKAIKDKIKMSKIKRMKQMAGRMEFVKTAEEIRHGDKRLG